MASIEKRDFAYWRRQLEKTLRDEYGRGQGGNRVWRHMSRPQREDAIMAAAAWLVFRQSNEVAERYTFADAQMMIGEFVDWREELTDLPAAQASAEAGASWSAQLPARTQREHTWRFRACQTESEAILTAFSPHRVALQTLCIAGLPCRRTRLAEMCTQKRVAAHWTTQRAGCPALRTLTPPTRDHARRSKQYGHSGARSSSHA